MTPTRVTVLSIELVQHGAVRATLTVSAPAPPAIPAPAPPASAPPARAPAPALASLTATAARAD